MRKIDILMSTYNGAKYLREQLDSILIQSVSNWNLFIRDDGSVDDTVIIIEEYIAKDSRIKFIRDNKLCGSAQSNFMELLNYSLAEFVFFCDQDDIWMEDKIEIMLKFIEQKDNNVPQVVFSDGYLYYGEKENSISNLLYARPKRLKDTLFCNGGIHGSLSIFNAVMRNKMKYQIEYVAMHDHLLTLIGCAYQTIDYLERPTFYYRQHSDNLTPHISTTFFSRIRTFFSENSKLPVVHTSHYEGVKSFYKAFKDELLANDRSLCELYINYPSKNAFVRFFSILRNGFSLNNSKTNLYLKLIFKKYKI